MNCRLLIVTIFLPTILVGGSFQINTQGIKAMGLGGLSTAIVSDASAVFYNPGALAHFSQNSITAGLGTVLPFTSYLDPYDGNSDMKVSASFPFHLYGVYHFKHKVTAGIAVNTPFSINTKWKNDWVGRYISQENRLRTLYIEPAIAYAVNEHLSIGGGPVFGWAKTKLIKAVDVSSSSVDYSEATFKNSGSGFGFNGGIYYIYNNFSAGVNYRSGIKFKLNNGTATYTDIPDGAVILEGIPSEADFNTTITMPAVFDAGVALSMNNKLQLTANFSFTQWSSIDSSNFDFPEHTSLNYAQVNNYDNAISISLGGQYHYNERTWFRAGLTREKTPVRDGYLSPASPDANKLVYCGGVSYTWKTGLTVDAAIMFQDYKLRIERNNLQNNFNGEYKTTLYIFGLGLNYAF